MGMFSKSIFGPGWIRESASATSEAPPALASSASEIAMSGNDDDLDSAAAGLQPKCIASTGDAFNGRTIRKLERHYQPMLSDHDDTNFFLDAQWSADGTSIVTLNNDESLRAFVLPPELLDPAQQPHNLISHSTLSSATRVQSYTLYPRFNLNDSSTTLILSSASDLPLRLTNALHSGYIHATYSHIHPTTEAFIASNSLTFIGNGSHFASGSQGSVSVFDASRDGEGPVITHRTKPKNPADAATSMRDSGKILALSESCDGFLAAGSSNCTVGIFSKSGHGPCETAFCVASSSDEELQRAGSGITSLAWTPNGQYLLVAERQSDGVHVYDVRYQLRRLAWLSGRRADTTQRLGIDIVPTADGCEVWAGGTDGFVRMWRNPGSMEGEQKPDAELKLHNDAVPSAVWHPGGAVLATCSGQQHFAEDDESSGSESDGGSNSDESSSDSEDEDVRLASARSAIWNTHREIDNTLRAWAM